MNSGQLGAMGGFLMSTPGKVGNTSKSLSSLILVKCSITLEYSIVRKLER